MLGALRRGFGVDAERTSYMAQLCGIWHAWNALCAPRMAALVHLGPEHMLRRPWQQCTGQALAL